MLIIGALRTCRFAYAENTDKEPDNREFIIFDDITAFTEGLEERLKAQCSLKYVHCAEGKWAAYFEGQVLQKCSWAVCDSNEELLAMLTEKAGEKEYSLQTVTYGDDQWFAYVSAYCLRHVKPIRSKYPIITVSTNCRRCIKCLLSKSISTIGALGTSKVNSPVTQIGTLIPIFPISATK